MGFRTGDAYWKLVISLNGEEINQWLSEDAKGFLKTRVRKPISWDDLILTAYLDHNISEG